MNDIQWLEKWYRSQCDGDWEHCYGIRISTLDNPGWAVQINLNETPLFGEPFDTINIDNSDDDWIICRIRDGYFEGNGDPDKLEKIISIFRHWVEDTERRF